MTLGRLVLAWLLVTIWFYASFVVTFALAAGVMRLAGSFSREANAVVDTIPRPLLHWRAIEAAALTLFASLWFDSLGSGGWVLVFLLVGIVATVPVQLLRTGGPGAKLAFAAMEAGELLRYLVAGALLAWRLS